MNVAGIRHTACTTCRAKKIRCDGSQPCCRNCLRRGGDCSYMNQGAAQERHQMVTTIQQLSERLARAESAIAVQHPFATSPMSLPDPIRNPPSVGASPYGNNMGGHDFNLPLFTMDGPSQSMPQLGCITPVESGITSEFPMSLGAKDGLALHGRHEFPQPVVAELYEQYFGHSQNGCYVLKKDLFMTRISTPDPGPEVECLQHIVLAQAAATYPPHTNKTSQLYGLARYKLEQSESGKSFTTIAALQACILMAHFELRSAYFLRAFTSISRALFMVHHFGLDRMDDPQRNDTSANPCLPVSHDESELEERRAAFWAALDLSCFANIGAGWNISILDSYPKITTFLPLDEGACAVPRLTLSESFLPANVGRLGLTQAYIVTRMLFGRAVVHLGHAGSETGSYDFWMNQYYLSQTVKSVKDALAANFDRAPDLRASCAKLDLTSALLCLNHAAGERVARTNTLPLAGLDCKQECADTAGDMARTCKVVLDKNLEWAPMCPSMPWSIYIAGKCCIRNLVSRRLDDPPAVSPSATAHWSAGWAWSSGNFPHVVSRSSSTSSASSYPFSSPLYGGLWEPVTTLLELLAELKHTNGVAAVFEEQLRTELDEGEAVASHRPVGRAFFPLCGW